MRLREKIHPGKYVGRKLDWVVMTEIFPFSLPLYKEVKPYGMEHIVRVETVFSNV